MALKGAISAAASTPAPNHSQFPQTKQFNVSPSAQTLPAAVLPTPPHKPTTLSVYRTTTIAHHTTKTTTRAYTRQHLCPKTQQR